MDYKEENNEVNEPQAFIKREIRIFASFEEQEEFERKQMQQLSPEERLMQMRQFINIAYGMHGYNPDNLPKKHTVKIIS